jgi:hypothetical protein
MAVRERCRVESSDNGVLRLLVADDWAVLVDSAIFRAGTTSQPLTTVPGHDR